MDLLQLEPPGSLVNNDYEKPERPSTTASTDSASGSSQITVILTVRLLMQGKEVGSIIGKRGEHVKNIRDRSGAKVNISDGSCPERVVSITGNMATINAAFQMISQKFEDDMQAVPNCVPKPPITMRLIIPATQCGSIIGKGGAKIREIREKTGASIQVASEMLPNSTERAVTISGTCEALIECMRHICAILQEAPAKGATLPFRPKPNCNPMAVACSAAAAAAAQQHQQQLATILQQQQQLVQQQSSSALMQNVLQYGQAAPIYGMVNPMIAKLPTGFPAVSQSSETELQQVLLNNIALAQQNQTILCGDELQTAALFALDPRIQNVNAAAASALASGSWSSGRPEDLLNAHLLNQGLLQTQQQAQCGGKIPTQAGINDSISAQHKPSGSSRSANVTLTNGTANGQSSTSRRFAPY